MIFLIVCVVALAILIFVVYRYKKNKRFIISNMRIKSTIIFGAKGNGKDLFTQWVINNDKQPYLSPLNYGNKWSKCKVGQLTISPNTYEYFINGEYAKIKKIKRFEGKNVYLSDVGVILPSQYDYLIHKNFPSLSLFYALSRHLYNMAIHCNTQNLERVFKGLREQADFFIHARGVVKLPFNYLAVRLTAYDKYNTALERIAPLKIRSNIFGKHLETIATFNAKYGLVKDFYILINKKHIYYDTRAYHKIIFGRKIKK